MRNHTNKTFAFKEQLRVGREIADKLDEYMTVAEVAKELGCSKQHVRVTECRALYKIALALRTAMRAGEFEPPGTPDTFGECRRKGLAP